MTAAVALSFLAVISSVCTASIARADDVLHFNTLFNEPYHTSEKTGFLDLLIAEVFRRVGKKVDIATVPAERSLINLNQGLDDGIVMRRSGLSTKYPNIRQVPEKVVDFQLVVFSKKVDFRVDSWLSLLPYSVGVIRGWKTPERKTSANQNVTKVRDFKQLFALLQNDRSDVVIYEKWQGLEILRTKKTSDIKLLEPPLQSVETFIYLNKKYESLVPKVAEALKTMKADGTYKQIFDSTFGVIMDSK